MNCPDAETLIAFAMNPLAAENDELAAHIHGCADCRLNLRLVNDTLLAADWKSPERPVDVAEALHLPSASRELHRQDDCADRRIEDYVRILDKDVKMPDGSWLRKGSRVLVDPHCPGRYEKATDFNMKRFVERGFSFFRNLLSNIETGRVLANAQNEINFWPCNRQEPCFFVGDDHPRDESPCLGEFRSLAGETHVWKVQGNGGCARLPGGMAGAAWPDASNGGYVA